MTVMVKLNGEDFNLESIYNSFHDNTKINEFLSSVMGKEDAIEIKKKGKHFNNSLVFNIMINGRGSKQSVKVFCNGSLHITGFKTLLEVLEVAEVFATIFEILDGGSGIDDIYSIKEYKVQLINIYYQTQGLTSEQGLDLQGLHRLIVEKSDYYSVFNNERYSGVVIKAPEFTVLVFDSGNIILTAITTIEQIRSAYMYMHNFMKTNIYNIRIDKMQMKRYDTKRVKENFDYGKYLVLK
jgi:TATA-box binding protein (TBP) (component of TFIID and TFIIIB)